MNGSAAPFRLRRTIMTTPSLTNAERFDAEYPEELQDCPRVA